MDRSPAGPSGAPPLHSSDPRGGATAPNACRAECGITTVGRSWWTGSRVGSSSGRGGSLAPRTIAGVRGSDGRPPWATARRSRSTRGRIASSRWRRLPSTSILIVSGDRSSPSRPGCSRAGGTRASGSPGCPPAADPAVAGGARQGCSAGCSGAPTTGGTPPSPTSPSTGRSTSCSTRTAAHPASGRASSSSVATCSSARPSAWGTATWARRTSARSTNQDPSSAGLAEQAAGQALLDRGLGVDDLLRACAGTYRSVHPSRDLDGYVEAQIHGGVSLAGDVEAVVLDPSFEGTAVEADLAAAAEPATASPSRGTADPRSTSTTCPTTSGGRRCRIWHARPPARTASSTRGDRGPRRDPDRRRTDGRGGPARVRNSNSSSTCGTRCSRTGTTRARRRSRTDRGAQPGRRRRRAAAAQPIRSGGVEARGVALVTGASRGSGGESPSSCAGGGSTCSRRCGTRATATASPTRWGPAPPGRSRWSASTSPTSGRSSPPAASGCWSTTPVSTRPTPRSSTPPPRSGGACSRRTCSPWPSSPGAAPRRSATPAAASCATCRRRVSSCRCPSSPRTGRRRPRSPRSGSRCGRARAVRRPDRRGPARGPSPPTCSPSRRPSPRRSPPRSPATGREGHAHAG